MGTTVLRWAEVVDRTLQNNAAANGNGKVFELGGMFSSLTVQVIGVFAATVNFEISQDKTNWSAILGQNLMTSEQRTTASSPGVYVFAVNGVKNFRARISGYSSGSVTVIATASPMPLAGRSLKTATSGEVLTQLTGSSLKKIDTDGYNTNTYSRVGSLAASTIETVLNVTKPCVLEGLVIKQDNSTPDIRFFIEFRQPDGTYNSLVGSVPTAIFTEGNYLSNVNDWKDMHMQIVSWDTTNNRYVAALQRPISSPNGIRVMIQNKNTTSAFNVAVQATVRQLSA